MGPDDWKRVGTRLNSSTYTQTAPRWNGDPEIRLSYKLPSDCIIFQAEFFAIRKAAEVAQNINRPYDVVNLFVNSQVSSTVSSKNVMATREAKVCNY